jgi:hypothetical protein
MKNRSAVGVGSILIALLMLATLAIPAGAAGFGAKLSKTSQPSNAEGGRRCDDSGGIPFGATCTWVATQSYRNAGHFKAPKSGRISKVKLVSCVKGSFRLQFARVKRAQDKAKIVRNGPWVKYPADWRQADGDSDTFCGGEEGKDYKVRTIKVKAWVKAGDYIAIKTKRTGTLYCSGGSDVLQFAPPLAAGGSFRKATDDASCQMLVRLIYR